MCTAILKRDKKKVLEIVKCAVRTVLIRFHHLSRYQDQLKHFIPLVHEWRSQLDTLATDILHERKT